MYSNAAYVRSGYERTYAYKGSAPDFMVQSEHVDMGFHETSNSQDYRPIKAYIPPEHRPPPKRVIELGSVHIDGASEEEIKHLPKKQSKKVLHKNPSKPNSGKNRLPVVNAEKLQAIRPPSG